MKRKINQRTETPKAMETACWTLSFLELLSVDDEDVADAAADEDVVDAAADDGILLVLDVLDMKVVGEQQGMTRDWHGERQHMRSTTTLPWWKV